MKQLNVLILDTDNRDIVSLVYHYCHLGHRVFLPAPGTPGFIRGKTPLWPRFLMKSAATGKRHIDTLGVPKYDECDFGEDRFLSAEIDDIRPYTSSVSVELIDLNKFTDINVWHSTPNSTSQLPTFFDVVRRHIPNAKWISSGLDHFNHTLHGNPKNVVKFLPANYDDIPFPGKNVCGMYRSPFEFEFLDIDTTRKDVHRTEFLSFNHNFAVRHPIEYKMFISTVELLRQRGISLTNYGGNVRGQGADPMYSDTKGKTGNFTTLSPRQAMKKYVNSGGVVHLKQYDWAGGVPTGCRFGGTPLVTTQKYIDDTHSGRLLKSEKTCLIGNDPEQLAQEVSLIVENDALYDLLSRNITGLNAQLHDENYWNEWREFIDRLE